MNPKPKGDLYLVAALAAILLTSSNPLTAASGCDGGGNCYIYASATGTGTGATWTNAYTGFGTAAHQVNPATIIRGVTYWIGAGNYGAVNLSTPDSGTQVVTLEGATTSSHGPAGDWNDGFAGQALFTGVSQITTDYWTLNGQTRGTDWKSGYTLKFWNQSDGSNFALGAMNSTTSHLTLEFLEIQGTTKSGTQYSDEGLSFYPQTNNLYVGSCWIHNVGSDNVSINYGGGGGSYQTFEYNYISYNHQGYNTTHSQCAQITSSNLTFRYNQFQDCMSSGFITDASGGTASMSNWEIYGNVFFWDSVFAALKTSFVGDGIIGFFGENYSGHMYFYNNTIAGISTTNTCSSSALGSNTVKGTQIYNNIWYSTPNCNPSDQQGGNVTMDYNEYFQNSSNSNDNSSHKATSKTNPFVNVSSNNFQLTTDTANGLSVNAPYNLDMNGTTRGADGVFDRGAFQIVSGSPAPPTNLTAVAQ